jgi:hypothetical protein
MRLENEHEIIHLKFQTREIHRLVFPRNMHIILMDQIQETFFPELLTLITQETVIEMFNIVKLLVRLQPMRVFSRKEPKQLG